MHRRLGILGLAAVIFSQAALAESEATLAASKKLQAAMREEIKEGKDKAKADNTPVDPGQRTRESVLKNLEEAHDEHLEVMDANNSAAAYFNSDSVRLAAEEFHAAIAADKQAAEDAEAKRMEDLLQRAAEAIKTSKTPSDLDGIMAALGATPRTGYSRYSESLQLLRQRLENAKNFLNYWQDYLAAKEAGDRDGTRRALENLSSNNRETSLIARSEILKLSRGQEEAHGNPIEIVLGIKSLEEMREAITRLRGLQQTNRGYNEGPQPLINSLSTLEKPYREYLAGLPVTMELMSSNSDVQGEAQTKLAELRLMLMKLVIPRYLDTPKDTAFHDGENVQDFLDRVVTEAKDREDMPLAVRARELRKTLSRGNNYTTQDATGLNSFVSGQNQEQAGQYQLAVISYQQALKSGSDLIPAKTIGMRLDAIKEAHPEEYAKAVERFMDPPVSRFPGDPYANMRNNGRPEPTPSPTLLIPPAKTEPEKKELDKKELEKAKEEKPAEKK